MEAGHPREKKRKLRNNKKHLKQSPNGESAGYAPICEHSFEGREGLVYHCGSDVLGAHVAASAVELWASFRCI